ncbi:hypothetical protein NIES2119_31385 [[Phormidium ambiguum] IAM M-71]|uniref:Uncharacterized protein n=1 Tax=[Phormidium ambiguum] IAM M-71 TaxID=454136 RepID=A0A1U7I2B0_9CYAN|nr:hypothetical protein [Phormidium ambiguum]OKH30175.1 hypothetical protein NIES2119_31385 [Phormidium ambiguum IAM M-71]
MNNHEYFNYWMQFWRASIDINAQKYAASMMGKKLGFNYVHPMNETQYLEVLKAIDKTYPWLYRSLEDKPRPGGWITNLNDALETVPSQFLA